MNPLLWLKALLLVVVFAGGLTACGGGGGGGSDSSSSSSGTPTTKSFAVSITAIDLRAPDGTRIGLMEDGEPIQGTSVDIKID